MANIKISELPAASAASTTQEFETNDSGTSKKVTGAQLKAFVKDGFVVADVTDLTATASELNILDGITGMASQAQAEAGTDNATLMTPLRVSQAIDANTAPSGIQTFTASGSIEAGRVVGVNSDGTVSHVGTVLDPLQDGYRYARTQRDVNTTSRSFVPGPINSQVDSTGAIALSNTTFVGAYFGSSSIVARITTVGADGLPTFGADFTAVASGVTQVDLIIKAGANSFAIFYRTAATNNLVVVGQVSGATITFGSPVTVQSGITQNVNTAISNGNGKILIVGTTTQTNNPLRIAAISVSGTTPTVGAFTVLRNTAPSFQSPCLAYDPVNDRYLLNAVQIATPWTVWSWAFSVSGTTLSVGSQQNVFGSQTTYGDKTRVIYDVSAGRFVITANYAVGVTPGWIRVYTATISGLVITASPQTTDTNLILSGFMTRAPDGSTLARGSTSTDIARITYDAGNSFKPIITTLNPISVGDSMAFVLQSELLAGSGLYVYQENITNSVSQTDTRVSIYGFSTVARAIGLAKTTVTTGQAVQVVVSGGIATGLSGLTVGSKYRLNAGGVISSYGIAFYGTAISATSLLVTTAE